MAGACQSDEPVFGDDLDIDELMGGAEGGRMEAGRKFSLAMRQLDTSVQLADRR